MPDLLDYCVHLTYPIRKSIKGKSLKISIKHLLGRKGLVLGHFLPVEVGGD